MIPPSPAVEPLVSDELEAHIQAFKASGVLNRSQHLLRLFDFLALCARSKRVPKELEVAIEGLGRSEGFDVSQDALVRVYAHKLRRKLDEYYVDKPGQARLLLPKGEYRLLLDASPAPPTDHPELPAVRLAPRPQRVLLRPIRFSRVLWVALLVSLLVNALLVFNHYGRGQGQDGYGALRAATLWQSVLSDERPVLIVVGDYYQYAEADAKEHVQRLVRDFEINSPLDLANYLQLHPQLATRQFDAGLSYLPTSVAHALNRIAPIVNGGKKPSWGVVLASELVPENLRSSHIVYLGHLSGMGILEEWVFARSGLRRGSSYDELVDIKSGKVYMSDSGLPGSGKAQQEHFALLSSFTGPGANRILVIAGFRDAGLRELSETLSHAPGLAALAQQNLSGQDFEALYQSSQLGSTSSPARMILAQPLKPIPHAAEARTQ